VPRGGRRSISPYALPVVKSPCSLLTVITCGAARPILSRLKVQFSEVVE
jgi:hypothetical protein